MLHALSIKNLGLIQQAELDLPSGLITITGETGAGKSMLLKALALLSGQRAQEHLIGTHGDKAEISACFDLRNHQEAKTWLIAQELATDTDQHECIIRRILHTQGAGRQYINQTPVNLKSLRQLTASLLDIHFQHQHQSLLSQPHQQALFDAYAGVSTQTKAMAHRYKNWQTLQQQLAAQENNQAQQQHAGALLRQQCAELDVLQPDTKHIQQLEQQHKELSFAQTLTEYSQQALRLLSDGDSMAAPATSDALGQIRKAMQLLERIQDKTDLTNLMQLLHSTVLHLEEAIEELTRHSVRFTDHPEQLQQLEQQLAQLHQLARKHKTTIHHLPEVHQQLVQQLAAIEHYTRYS